MYKKLLILGLIKGRCNFVTSDFPSENPRIQNRNISYTNTLGTRHDRKKPIMNLKTKRYENKKQNEKLLKTWNATLWS